MLKITVDPDSIPDLIDWLRGSHTGEDGLDIEQTGNGLHFTIGLSSCEITAVGSVLPE